MAKTPSLKIVAATVCAAALLAPATTALANDTPLPPSHCGTSTGDNGTSSWIDHTELGERLTKLAAQSKGTMTVETIGHSNQGREIWAARVGTGSKVVLVESEIHGNEKTGTHAILNLLRTMTSPSPEGAWLRDNITLVAVPQINPDGSELDRRANDRTWAEVVAEFPQLAGAAPAWNYYTRMVQGDDYASRPGFDVNRDFHPDLDYVPSPEDFPGTSGDPGWYIHPESQAMRDLYVDLQGEFGKVDTFIDLHHQGACSLVGDEGKWVTMSLSGKFVDVENHAQWASGYDLDYSKQLNLLAYDALQAKGNSPFGNLSLYPQDIDLPGTALGSFALNGSGTVLFEVRGQTQTWGSKQKGQLIKTVETGLMAIVEGVATGDVRELDPSRYDSIPVTKYPPR